MENKTWVTVGIVSFIVAIFLVMYFVSDPFHKICGSRREGYGSVPGKCGKMKAGRSEIEGYWGEGTAAKPVWQISWSPPTTGGVGVGYTVTYAGSVVDSQKKTVYTFSKLATPSISLPDTTPPGNYSVSVVAWNQYGAGPAYVQSITLANHTPSITSTVSTYNNQGVLTLTSTGNFPDVDKNQYTYSFQMYQEEPPNQISIPFTVGKVIKFTPTEWVITLNVMQFQNYPGIKVQTQVSLCNYDMCAYSTSNYVQTGPVPGLSSGLVANFSY